MRNENIFINLKFQQFSHYYFKDASTWQQRYAHTGQLESCCADPACKINQNMFLLFMLAHELCTLLNSLNYANQSWKVENFSFYSKVARELLLLYCTPIKFLVKPQYESDFASYLTDVSNMWSQFS